MCTQLHAHTLTCACFTAHRDNGAGYECTHYCFPSAQQTWVFAFYRALTLRYRGAVADPTAAFVDEQRRGRLLLHA